MLLRVVFTVVVTGLCVWLLADGKPLGGLLLLPALAIWVRHRAESRGATTDLDPSTADGDQR